MLTRAITGAVFVAIMLAAILLGEASFFILFLLVSTIASYEWATATQAKYTSFNNSVLYMVLGIVIYASMFYMFKESRVYVDKLMFISAAFFVLLLRAIFDDNDKIIEQYSAYILGFVWIFIGILGLLYLAYYQHYYSWVLLLGTLVFIWTNDTFAYLTGKAIGKTKLFESVSPNKTWEGTIGGAIVAIIAGAVWSIFFDDFSTFNWMLIAFVAGTTGTIGDLFESKMKRALGIKDLGNIMPGHGGILDRFDALLFAAPAVSLVLISIELMS